MTGIRVVDGTDLLSHSYDPSFERESRLSAGRAAIFYELTAFLAFFGAALGVGMCKHYRLSLTQSISLLSLPTCVMVYAGYEANENLEPAIFFRPPQWFTSFKTDRIYHGIFPINNSEIPEIPEAFILSTDQLLVDEFKHAVKAVFSELVEDDSGLTRVERLLEDFGGRWNHVLLPSEDVVFGVRSTIGGRSRLNFWGNAPVTFLNSGLYSFHHYGPTDETRFPAQSEEYTVNNVPMVWAGELVSLHSTVLFAEDGRHIQGNLILRERLGLLSNRLRRILEGMNILY